MDEKIRKRIVQARVKLILDHPFFGQLASRFILIENSNMPMPTMATDGRNLMYDPGFVDSLSQAELIGLVAHVTMHVALGHPWRLGLREPRRANAAMDYAVNPIVVDAGLTLPQGALLDNRFRNMSFEQIYDLLQSPPQSNSPGQGSASGAGPIGNVPPEMTGQVQSPDALVEHIETLASDWQVATLLAAQTAKMMGKLPAGLEQLIDAIKHPKVDWKPILRRFMQECAKSDYNWRMPNRRFLASGMYLPSLRSESMPPIVWAMDSSGSCWDAETQTRFASELTSVVEECKPEKVYAPYCDTKVYKPVRVFEPGEPLEFRIKGGGGTDFRDIFRWIEQENIEPACLIVTTDTYGNFPDHAPSYPVLWASTIKNPTVPFGEVIDISE